MFLIMPPPSKAKAPAKGGPAKSKKKAATAKPPLSEPERIKKLFNSLVAQIADRHWKNAIKTCDKSEWGCAFWVPRSLLSYTLTSHYLRSVYSPFDCTLPSDGALSFACEHISEDGLFS